MSIGYDPFSLECRSDPYAYYARLRNEEPVYWAEASRMFVVARYADVVSILTDPDRFSNDAMATVLAIGGGREPEPGAPRMPGNVVSYDPPDHTRLHGIVNRAFTPRRVESWRTIVEAETRAAIERMRTAGAFDVVADLAAPVPPTIIAHVLGIGPEHRDDFKRRATIISASMTGSLRLVDPVESGAAKAQREQGRHLAGVIAERQAEPREDIVSELTRAESGEILSSQETLGFAAVLTFAGSETTTNLIGNAVRVLVEHPDVYERVVEDPSRIDALLEETLRWDSPVQYLFRRAKEDVEIAGTKEKTAYLFVSGHRKFRVWVHGHVCLTVSSICHSVRPLTVITSRNSCPFIHWATSSGVSGPRSTVPLISVRVSPVRSQCRSSSSRLYALASATRNGRVGPRRRS